MVSNIMHSNIITVDGDETVKKALELMNDNNINGAPVVDEKDNLIGMIVKADIYRFLIADGHYDTYPVNSVMSKDVVTAAKDEEVLTVVKRIRDKDIIAIPVVEDNKVIGIITIEDIVDYFIEYMSR